VVGNSSVVDSRIKVNSVVPSRLFGKANGGLEAPRLRVQVSDAYLCKVGK